MPTSEKITRVLQEIETLHNQVAALFKEFREMEHASDTTVEDEYRELADRYWSLRTALNSVVDNGKCDIVFTDADVK